MTPALAELVRRMPKVELHVHLEGSMRPRTLLQLARRRRVTLPAETPEGLREWFRFRDFEHFVEVYLACSLCLREPEDFQLLVDDFMAQQARQNVVYSEAHFTIGTHLMQGGSGGELRDALWEAAVEGERRHGVRLRLVPDIVRNVPYRWADRTAEWALDGRQHGVVALGLSGYEATHPNEPFRSHFVAAAEAGLHRVAHAGEHAGPRSIRSVLAVCGAERIGHGVRAVEDPDLVQELAARGVPLEVCPSSNLALGVVPELTEHPFDALYRAGVPVTVNSDDPPLFGTTLSAEYERLGDAFGYDAPTLAGFAIEALRASFLPADERAAREVDFRRQLAALGAELLGEAVVPAERAATAPAS
ncbi:MAG TPA: adenosine deaminase [Thermoanaerobaculia bacterium]|nr:adenosine deaminase [Thermoanaerobaculia bacterium]